MSYSAGEKDPGVDEDGFYIMDDDAESASIAGSPRGGGSADPGDEEFEVEIVDDRPASDRVPPRDVNRASAADDFADESKDEEADKVLQTNRVKRLRYEWNEERRAKESAERQREAAIQFAETVRAKNDHLQTLLRSGERVLVDEVRARTKSDVEQARSILRKAVGDGDPDMVASAQENLSRAVYDQRQAESYRIQEESREAVAQPAPTSVHQADHKFEAWHKNNPWFKQDDQMTDRAMSIHRRLTEKDGILPMGDEYYRRIDSEMRRAFPSKFSDGVVTAPGSANGKVEPARKRTGSVVAPATRNAGGTTRKVQLTASEVSVAKRLGIPIEQYAKEVAKLAKEAQ